MIKTGIHIAAMLLIISCQSDSSDATVKEITIDSNMKIDESIAEVKLDSINVISLKEEYKKGLIQLYNADGSIWKSFEVTDSYNDEQIQPYAQKAENILLVFRCIGRYRNFYSVLVNEQTHLIKYIKPNVKYFTYETWERHILKVFSVDFNNVSNPLKSSPDRTSKTLKLNEEEFYHPVEIKGEWLKVKDGNDKEGWILWKDAKGNLIVNLYYDA